MLLETKINVFNLYLLFCSEFFIVKGIVAIDGYFPHVWTHMNLIRVPLYIFTLHTLYSARTFTSECWVILLRTNEYEK